jgi:aryl-alcohol dehydrogenase-like predicted oxidoreductase
MDYGTIAGIGEPVSRLVLGTMIITIEEQEQSFALLDAAVELGWTAFDTAHGHASGNSERGLGQWMQARGNREEVVMISLKAFDVTLSQDERAWLDLEREEL